MIKNIEFYSDGNLLKGHIYYPANFSEGNEYPAIILCHGFAGVKELLLPNFANNFAKEGFLVFTFDYRGFGESEGDRGVIIPNEQVSDIRNAITYVSSLKEVDSDKIALWGTSLGGANALVATAKDSRIKSLAVQITFANGERNNTSDLSNEEKQNLNTMLHKSWTNQVTRNRYTKLPLKKVLHDEQSIEFFNSHIEKFPEAMAAKIPLTTTLLINEFKPEEYFHKIDVPVHVVCAEKDIVNLPSEAKEIYNRLSVDKKELLNVDATHYDIYYGDNLKTVSKAQANWFKNML